MAIYSFFYEINKVHLDLKNDEDGPFIQKDYMHKLTQDSIRVLEKKSINITIIIKYVNNIKGNHDKEFEILTKKLKDKIIDYFHRFPDVTKEASIPQICKNFNELTLELLKIFFLLLQFGFFKIGSHDFSSEAYYKEKNKENLLPNDTSEKMKGPNDEACINQIFKILAFLLEFDYEYFQDLHSNNIICGK